MMYYFKKEKEESRMNVKLIGALMFASMFLVPILAEGDVSLQFKSSTPGIAGQTSAEIIFDVVNTDLTNYLQGFLWCQTPDNTVVSSSLGAGTGSGAQYVSPIMTMNPGPSQKSITLTLDTAAIGTYDAKCYIKYIPYTEINGTKSYLKMNGERTDAAVDNDYRLLRLDNLIEIKGAATTMELPAWLKDNWLVAVIVLLVIAIAYIGGKASK